MLVAVQPGIRHQRAEQADAAVEELLFLDVFEIDLGRHVGPFAVQQRPMIGIEGQLWMAPPPAAACTDSRTGRQPSRLSNAS